MVRFTTQTRRRQELQRSSLGSSSRSFEASWLRGYSLSIDKLLMPQLRRQNTHQQPGGINLSRSMRLAQPPDLGRIEVAGLGEGGWVQSVFGPRRETSAPPFRMRRSQTTLGLIEHARGETAPQPEAQQALVSVRAEFEFGWQHSTPTARDRETAGGLRPNSPCSCGRLQS